MNNGLNPHLGNIFTVYARADRWDIENGMWAYQRYHRELGHIGLEFEVPTRRVCAVFAALSPNIDEASTFRSTKILVQALVGNAEKPPRCSGYALNREKAWRILNGEEPLSVLSGDKVRAFFECIHTMGMTQAVVVDAHIYSVWSLKRFKVQGIKLTTEKYEAIADDFRTVARKLGIEPPQLQAICWFTWKRIHNIVYDSQLGLFKHAMDQR